MKISAAIILFLGLVLTRAASGDDLEFGPMVTNGFPAGRLSDAANRCANREMNAVFAALGPVVGAKSDQNVQNLARLVADESLAKRLVRKCAPHNLPIWNVDNAQAKIVLPMWNTTLSLRNLMREDAVEKVYYDCLKEKAARFAAASDENAEAVIAAARGACFDQRQAILAAAPMNLNPVEEADKADKRIHDRMVEWVIGVRAELKARNSRPTDDSNNIKQGAI